MVNFVKTIFWRNTRRVIDILIIRIYTKLFSSYHCMKLNMLHLKKVTVFFILILKNIIVSDIVQCKRYFVYQLDLFILQNKQNFNISLLGSFIKCKLLEGVDL